MSRRFPKCYLQSQRGATSRLEPVQEFGAHQVSFVPRLGRLTNLKELTVDTSWWTATEAPPILIWVRRSRTQVPSFRYWTAYGDS